MDKSIDSKDMPDYEPRIEAIASAWAYNEGGGKEAIFSRLIDHAKKGWLSSEWVNGAYEAILNRKHLEFHYDKKSKTSVWLAGSSPEQVRETLKKAVKNGFNMRMKNE